MGVGDEIMVTGEARRLQESDARPVVVLDRHDRPRWHDMWELNPRFIRSFALPSKCPPGDTGAVQTHRNGPGCRPYIDYERTIRLARSKFGDMPRLERRAERWIWNSNYRAIRGDIHFGRFELREMSKSTDAYVVIEPHVKQRTPNKFWGFRRYQAIVNSFPDVRFVQLAPFATRILDGVTHIRTDNFRLACAYLSMAKAYVGPEGGLHHAAAALNIPAVVIFGGFISPETTGYDGHINLYIAEGSPCGWRIPCDHCRDAMAQITPEIVAYHLRSLLT